MSLPILALDLGTKTGWAMRTADGGIESGTFDNTLSASTRKKMTQENEGWERSHDPRYVHLFLDIEFKVLNNDIRKIVFEDVQFSEYTLQTQLWATFRAAAWAQTLRRPGLAFGCLNTSTLKLVATGKGNATKAMMAAWLVKKYPDRFCKLDKPDPKKELYIQKLDGTPVDDNEVDAFHLLKHFSP